MTWKHDDLANDLATHLRSSGDRMVWTNMQMGPSGSPRPDVYTLAKSFSRPMPASYEIKISRSDFLSDCNAGKWQKYLAFSAGVFFAVPAGLIKKEECPPGCGLILRHEKVWRAVKSPRWGKCEIGGDVAMKLLIDGLDRLSQAQEIKPRRADEWHVSEKVRKKHGELVAKLVRDITWGKKHLQILNADVDEARKKKDAATAEATTIRRKAEEEGRAHVRADWLRQVSPLCNALGLPFDAPPHEVSKKLRMAVIAVQRDEMVAALRRHIDTIRSALTAADETKIVPVKKQARSSL